LNEAYFEVGEDWSGDFTIRVKAVNYCGESPWSADFLGSANLTPAIFTLQGGGGYCEGGTGVEITLDGSQEGVDYELYLDGEATGQVVSGTGESITFGNQTEAGLYEAFGFSGNCEAYMSEQVEVMVYSTPTPEITGLDMVCDNDVTDYETTLNDGSSYSWEVTGGEIIEGEGTSMITIEWGEAGEGTVTVTETDENGCEATTETFAVFIDDCTAIGENEEMTFRSYPNPASNRLTIAFTGNRGEEIRIMILNHLGQVVQDRVEMGEGSVQRIEIDVTRLTDGLYFIRLDSRTGSRIIKQIIRN
jgi:hypothetical protein